ncbi:MAG: M23 family metallopeptidase [Motilibacteraceae bacterium]
MRRRGAGTAVVALLLALPVATVAHADAPPPPTSLAQAQSDLDESSATTRAAVTALREAEAALPAARATADAAQQRLTAAEAVRDVALDRLQAVQSAELSAQRSSEDLADAAAAQHAELVRLVRQTYIDGPASGGPAQLTLLLDARSPADFADGLVTVQRALDGRRRAMDDALNVVTQARAQQDALTRRRTDVAAAQQQAQAALEAVAAVQRAAADALARVDALVRQRGDALAAAQAASAQDEAQYQQLLAEGSQLGQQLAGDGLAGVDEPLQLVTPVPGSLQRPATGPITSPFGMRVHPVTGVYKLHSGVDWGVPCGTPVSAAATGRVLAAGRNIAYGNRIVLVHDDVGPEHLRIATTYNHLSRIDVTVGQQVSAGQVVGLSGTTGYSTGCHLHFEVWAGGQYVDPLPWLAP